jgi:hypothetical protein
MAMSYRPLVAQMNKESPPESSLNLTLMQHLHDEDSGPQEVHACLEVEPPQAWYYRIFPNSCTLVTLLQIDPASGHEPETVCGGCSKLKTFLSLHGLQFPTLDTIIG